jgi:hypothetical protein
MRKFTIAIVAVVALMLFSGMLLAQEEKVIKLEKGHKCMAGEHQCKGDCYGKCKSATCLGLDAEQKAKLHELKYKLKLAEIDLKADVKKLELELKHEMMSDDPSKKTVDKLVTDLFAAKAKIKKLSVDLAFDAKTFLKPEQWKKMLKMHMAKKAKGGCDCCGSGGCCSGGHGMMQKKMKMLHGGGCCSHGGDVEKHIEIIKK